MMPYRYVIMQGENFVTIPPRVPWVKGIGLLCLRGVRQSSGYKAAMFVVEVIMSLDCSAKVFTPIT